MGTIALNPKINGSGIYGGSGTIPSRGRRRKKDPFNNLLWWIIVASAVLVNLYYLILG